MNKWSKRLLLSHRTAPGHICSSQFIKERLLTTMAIKYTNLDYLNEISGGDNRLLLEMIEIFNTEVPGYLQRMNQLLEMGDFEGLGKLAHKAKASASIMGMNEVATDLKDLERLAEIKDMEKLPSHILSIQQKFNSAIDELDQVYKTIKK
jgi:HPt (histidine-containing phosphotransfer) domain-containing protein